MKNYLCKFTKFYLVLFVIAISLLAFMPFSETVYADSMGVKEISNKKTIVGFGNSNTTRWMTESYQIAYAYNDDYSNRTYNDVYPYYYKNSQIVVGETNLNTEIYKLEGTDSTGLARIQPVENFTDENNITAVSYASIDLTKFRDFCNDSYCGINDDSRDMANLESNIRIQNNYSDVSTGKVMYRSSQSSTWMDWRYCELEDNVHLYFSGKQSVQLVVFYEIKEDKPWKFNRYHHVLAIYRFDIV